MKNVHYPPPPRSLNIIKKSVVFFALLFFSSFSLLAYPNIESEVFNLDNPDYCSGSTVETGLNNYGDTRDYYTLRIKSALLYVEEDLGSGVYKDRLVAQVGQQPNKTTTVTFNNVYGVGRLKVVITLEVQGTSSDPVTTMVLTSTYYQPNIIISGVAPAINTFGVLGALTNSTNPYELANCRASLNDLDIDIDYIYGLSLGNPTATIEIFSVLECTDPTDHGNMVYSEDFDEYADGNTIWEFFDDVETDFKDFVANNVGTYVVRLTINAGECGDMVSEDYCINITGTPDIIDFELTGCAPDPFTPKTGPFSPEHIQGNAPVLGGTSGTINGSLSHGHYTYYRFKVEKNTPSGFINVTNTIWGTDNPVFPDPSNPGKYLNLSVNLNTLIQNSGDKLYNNPGVDYRVTLYLGSDCGEVSEHSFFKTDNDCWDKSAAASAPISEKTRTVKAFPQPAINVFTLEVTNFEGLQYELLGLDGSLLSKREITGMETSINISKYAAGIYFLRVSNADYSYVHKQKLIIQ